jgi:hypothetical protein
MVQTVGSLGSLKLQRFTTKRLNPSSGLDVACMLCALFRVDVQVVICNLMHLLFLTSDILQIFRQFSGRHFYYSWSSGLKISVTSCSQLRVQHMHKHSPSSKYQSWFFPSHLPHSSTSGPAPWLERSRLFLTLGTDSLTNHDLELNATACRMK